MERQIFQSLNLTRRRLNLRWAFQLSVYGLLLSVSLIFVAGIWRLISPYNVSTNLLTGILVAGPVLGCLVALFTPRKFKAAASLVDEHYQLKDRTSSALEFSGKADETELHQLQIEDAIEHVKIVKPSQVVPFHWPKTLTTTLFLLTASTAMLFWPLTSQEIEAGPKEADPGILKIVDEIKEDIEQIEEIAKEEENKDLENLVKELQETLEEMKKPEVDVKEALAKISEMQASIVAQQAEFNELKVTTQLKSLGNAMMSAEQFKGVAQELEKGDLEKAAEKLENIKDLKLKRKESKAVSERMKKVAKKMKKAGMGQMSESTSEMSEGISTGDSGKFSKGKKRFGKSLKKCSGRKKINKLLTLQLNKLRECKSQCKKCGSCSSCGSKQCQGGQCNGNKNSFKTGLNPKKSTSPKNTFGMSTSGNLFGDKTKLNSNRNLKQITGQAGEGPSEKETTNSPEGREQSTRSFKKVYKKYQKMSEAVLESEPIPLGQRQTIRKYFELIRPGQEERTSASDSTVN